MIDMSFRDLMPLCYLGDDRMGTRELLYPTNFMRALKLRQVVDVLLGVQDNSDNDFAKRIAALEDRRKGLIADIVSLERFAEEHRTPPSLELAGQRERAEIALGAAQERLAALDTSGRAATQFAATLHASHVDAVNEARAASDRVRSRSTQLKRLASLEAQYDADASRLEFLAEVGVLFNDLHVTHCPACLNELKNEPNLEGGSCSLCGHAVVSQEQLTLGVAALQPDSTKGGDAEGQFDPRAELRALKRRHRELNNYRQELATELGVLEAQLTTALDTEQTYARELNERTREALSPSLQEREALMRGVAAVQTELQRISSQDQIWLSLENRRSDQGRVELTLRGLREEDRDSRKSRPTRDVAVNALSIRFAKILEAFEFPRLSDAFIDNNLRPWVRGIEYGDQSDGAKTLISLAWTLSLFEANFESGGSHPGFLLLDSPQRGFGGVDAADPEFRDTRLVNAFYEHVLGWLDGPGRGAQVIVADNAAPPLVEDFVSVRYTGDPLRSPYGLIDDETA
jgi:hypothetical protein